jgi:hypothetical protein
MEKPQILLIFAGLAIMVAFLSAAATIYLLLGCFYPRLNIHIEDKINSLFRKKPSCLIINHESFVRERNQRILVNLGWVPF